MLHVSVVGDPDRPQILKRLVQRASVGSSQVAESVRRVIEEVRLHGDEAVRAFTQKWEGRTVGALELTGDEWNRLADETAPEVAAALATAERRIARFHERQRAVLEGYRLDDDGVELELRVQPLSRVGLYVPGGSARYPSSVLMTAVPARLAGVGEIVMVTPGPSAETLHAARLAGVHRVFVVGGAQAVAALAFGTHSVPRVDKIVGPGNAYVAEAKRQLFGVVDIDQVAGPSEILIIADETADASLVAADLLSQAEHDADAHAILVTTSFELASAVQREVAAQLESLPRRQIAEQSIDRHGTAIVMPSIDDALAFAEEFAPEHLELMTAGAAAQSARVRNAGAIFIGASTPEAAGDYLAGPNHVLPTGGAARHGSPLGVYDFVKRTSLLRYTPEALAQQAGEIVRLAQVEGLDAHGRAVSRRQEKK